MRNTSKNTENDCIQETQNREPFECFKMNTNPGKYRVVRDDEKTVAIYHKDNKIGQIECTEEFLAAKAYSLDTILIFNPNQVKIVKIHNRSCHCIDTIAIPFKLKAESFDTQIFVPFQKNTAFGITFFHLCQNVSLTKYQLISCSPYLVPLFISQLSPGVSTQQLCASSSSSLAVWSSGQLYLSFPCVFSGDSARPSFNTITGIQPLASNCSIRIQRNWREQVWEVNKLRICCQRGMSRETTKSIKPTKSREIRWEEFAKFVREENVEGKFKHLDLSQEIQSFFLTLLHESSPFYIYLDYLASNKDVDRLFGALMRFYSDHVFDILSLRIDFKVIHPPNMNAFLLSIFSRFPLGSPSTFLRRLNYKEEDLISLLLPLKEFPARLARNLSILKAYRIQRLNIASCLLNISSLEIEAQRQRNRSLMFNGKWASLLGAICSLCKLPLEKISFTSIIQNGLVASWNHSGYCHLHCFTKFRKRKIEKSQRIRKLLNYK